MCRNMSNMLLVLFIVVLGLPASQGQRFFFGVDDCWRALYLSGNKYCRLCGYDKYDSWIFTTCELGCGGRNVQLPKKACPNGTMHNPCTEDELHHLQKWAKTLETKRAKNRRKWCTV
uniref:Putative ixodes 10 kDa peptide protein n=1 Tax=Ixodes ricinus TaxID=34613 RepID=A0A0K8RBW0_IXORI